MELSNLIQQKSHHACHFQKLFRKKTLFMVLGYCREIKQNRVERQIEMVRLVSLMSFMLFPNKSEVDH